MITGGKFGRRHVAETGRQAFTVVQHSNEPVQMLLSVVQVEVILGVSVAEILQFSVTSAKHCLARLSSAESTYGLRKAACWTAFFGYLIDVSTETAPRDVRGRDEPLSGWPRPTASPIGHRQIPLGSQPIFQSLQLEYSRGYPGPL